MKIELTDRDLQKVRQFYSDELMMWGTIALGFVLGLAVILVMSSFGIEASSKFIYKVFLIFYVSLAFGILAILRMIGTLACFVAFRLGKFKVCCSKKVRRFSNVKYKRKEIKGDLVYVKCLYSRIFIKVR